MKKLGMLLLSQIQEHLNPFQIVVINYLISNNRQSKQINYNIRNLKISRLMFWQSWKLDKAILKIFGIKGAYLLNYKFIFF